MNAKSLFVYGSIAIIILLIGFGVGRFTVANKEDHSGHNNIVATEEDNAPTTWTCSMHPQIQQSEPGDCPICGMDLIPLDDNDSNDLGPRAMSMSESSLALADIQTTLVQREFPTAEIKLVGKLEYDETQVKSLTARFPARIEKLILNYTGVPVKTGEQLAVVYSPELLTAQTELITANRVDPNSSLTRTIREKLRLWGLLPEQIDEIVKEGKPSDRFTIKAPAGGIVIAKNVNEGDYVETGETLFKIVDLDRLWLFLDAYESDLPWLRYGQKVNFTVEAWPGEIFTGIIAFIEPELNRKTRTIGIRVNVENQDGRLKPGMFARGTVESKVAEGGQVYTSDLAGKWISPMHPEIIKDGPGQCDVCGMDLVPIETLGYVSDSKNEEAPLVIPASAVLRTGKRAVAYVQVPDTEQPTFEGREIVLGARAGDDFIVKEGLAEGERVVTNGAFKIDSALQIKAKPSMMNPGILIEENENGGMGAMMMDKVIEPLPPLASSLLKKTLPDYFALQSALANDNFDTAKAALKSMMSKTGHSGELAELIHTMLAAKDLNAIRRPYFEILSNAFIAAAKENSSEMTGEIYLMSCPMVYDDRGAAWLQTNDEVMNPYFGEEMLMCGEVLEKLNDGK
ncbi:efflux RND transporter periplasmic adaptor subunit [Rubellicoccus peritrichatus]|uniref:Efflux RND transporter periplasmic adaptor subunit n=1 Tax=Rubellicoccus peritrichatus TaxID=3080537 RepID=A0AAQ3QSU8_9BACT|nr:efflux RND transporter periplasmic adaptor subunit [Puniceicoccus sp. CR14]WOO42968.1 efflux RND transporter periplasmic adaptor subunit [Puniceicoccus sp. CR14]